MWGHCGLVTSGVTPFQGPMGLQITCPNSFGYGGKRMKSLGACDNWHGIIRSRHP